MGEIKKCRGCGDDLTIENTSPSFLERGFKACRKCDQKERSNRLAKNRTDVVMRLGGKCGCCGINNYDLLSIDHIGGEGIKDRHSFKSWKKYIKFLQELPVEELLSKYRCLCYNCNYTMGFWNKCPHQFCSDPIPRDKLVISDRTISNTHLLKEEYNERRLAVRKIQRLRHRLEMIGAYGGSCNGCGENHPLFLTLDHMNNNGCFDVKGAGFYQQLKELGYPGKNIQLQLLCHNCNAKKEYIDRRLNKSVIVNPMAEIYIKQEYNMSKEQEAVLWHKARELHYLISKYIYE